MFRSSGSYWIFVCEFDQSQRGRYKILHCLPSLGSRKPSQPSDFIHPAAVYPVRADPAPTFPSWPEAKIPSHPLSPYFPSKLEIPVSSGPIWHIVGTQ